MMKAKTTKARSKSFQFNSFSSDESLHNLVPFLQSALSSCMYYIFYMFYDAREKFTYATVWRKEKEQFA